MWKVTLPDKALEELRCTSCNEYLSQLPVYMYPDKDDVQCGRCPVLSEEKKIRAKTYESVAKHLFFPCRYKASGCLEQILPSEIHAHEEGCSYKQYFCPFIPQGLCVWQGLAQELFAHYEEEHKALALQSPSFEIDLIHKYEDNYLINQDGDVFVIQIKCETKENIFWLAVRYVGKLSATKEYVYEVELSNHNVNQNRLRKLSLPSMPVHDDSDMSLDISTATKINRNDVLEALEDPTIVICKLTIIKSSQKISEDLMPSTKTLIEDADEKILMEMECPVCHEYMVPPIYQCVIGHSICNNCKPGMNNSCPTCRNIFQDTRNFTLESLTRQFKYCCKYRDFDCTYVGNSANIKEHEDVCIYGPFDCPLLNISDDQNCKWKGKYANIMDHVKQEHEDNVMEMEVVSFPICNDDVDCYVFKMDDQMFRLLFKYENHMFYWCLQVIGPQEECKKYMLELDVVDGHSGSNQRLFIRKGCSPFADVNSAISEENNNCIELSLKLLQSFIVDNDLVYKWHVVKI